MLAPFGRVPAEPPVKRRRPVISQADAQLFRRPRRQTWAYFEALCCADDHGLPPDNCQEDA